MSSDAATPMEFWYRLPYSQREKYYNWALNLVLSIGLVLILFPIYWMVATSLMSPEGLFSLPNPLVPTDVTLETYRSVLETDVLLWYRNTIFLAAGVVGLTTVAATLGGYGLARLDIPFKKTFARVILFGYMFPPILLSIPMFIFWRQIGIINSLPGVIIAQTATTLPFSLWLMWQFFQTVPYSYEESARIIGCSRFQAFYEIALPLAKPGMIAVAIFSFAIAWGAYTIPTVLLTSNSKWVLTLGLYSFTQQESVLWGQIMAASTMLVLPTFAFVYYLQKYILRGFRATRI
ncbi:carbohydrate ABC transporter permease [Halobellus clavatus]|jgi:multiple sugar transport system permease protein|uniref:Multiple sugar transport system permease protein n=1 Tax=Halobellus clavatus TaxID=660517 RepID=A0A1H3DC10_9EURY|nr:carbohydrate ABC transporter permease [Halobellus clavatus]SDX64052.1 multiple sugar transport system permease protein [Halobellus clavatus]